MKKMMMNKQMSDADYFSEWYERFGVRTYFKGSPADQHRGYMAAAFLAGYHTSERNNHIVSELMEENRRLKNHINCLIP
jgi:hypothetical protein